MKKKVIIHLIYNLGRGGAENILVQTLSELTDFENYIVTFSQKNDFSRELIDQQVISLDTPHIWQLPLAIIKLRKLLVKLKPSLIHSQLTNPNIVARFATPQRIPLITSIQNSVKYNVEFKKWYIRWLEKRSLAFRRSHVLFVANSVKNDYSSFLNTLPEKYSILYNFVDIRKFKNKGISENERKEVYKIISVGSFSYQKNFEFLIAAFLNAHLPNTELHIYGEGADRPQLEKLIGNEKNRVRLMGVNKNIHQVLPTYNLYVSSSRYEGLSLSILEAMASGVPLLLTDIPSFREQCKDGAMYFEPGNEGDFIEKLGNAILVPEKLQVNVQKCSNRVNELFTREHYIRQLRAIYEEVISC